MILMSLLLASTPAPAVKPEAATRREAPRPRPVHAAQRSKRLVELEAAVRALAPSPAEPVRNSGPEGL